MRTYQIFVPPNDTGKRIPVILLLHPAASTGRIVWDQTSLPRLALQHRILLIAPDGVNKTWNTHFWTEGGRKDVSFLSQLLDRAVKELGGDPERLYVTGMSAGAGMTFTLAWTIGDRLAAIGPVANNLGAEMLDHPMIAKRPIPVVHIMGTQDGSVPYEGGKVFGIWPVLSAKDTVTFWVEHNRASPVGEVAMLPNLAADDNTRVLKEVFRGGNDGADVVHYRIVGGGHTWPNGPSDAIGKRLLGETTRDIDSGEVLWAFFSGKRRL
jgi:polyhydroxybutyrate depolymerase